MAYYLTIKVAMAGARTVDGTSVAGHMWYSLYDDSTGQENSYGFGPKIHEPIGPGERLRDDDTTYLDGPMYHPTVEITKEQYDAMKNFGENPFQNGQFSNQYNVLTNSCIDFVYKALEIGGINLNGTDGIIEPLANIPIITIMLLCQQIGVYGNQISVSLRDLYNSAQLLNPFKDPLTLDLDGDGIETVAASTTNPILFDHDGDGTKNGTGWIKGDDGFLVLDRNNNGTIDSGQELFGDSTPLAGGGTAADGFAALAQEDTNADGVVNNLDTRWSQLRVWQDLNQDGVSQAGELLTMRAFSTAPLCFFYTA